MARPGVILLAWPPSCCDCAHRGLGSRCWVPVPLYFAAGLAGEGLCAGATLGKHALWLPHSRVQVVRFRW